MYINSLMQNIDIPFFIQMILTELFFLGEKKKTKVKTMSTKLDV